MKDFVFVLNINKE